MSFIRLDPAELREAAGEITQVAQEYRGLAEQARQAAQNAPSYDGQFGPRVWPSGDEAHARLSRLAGDLTDLGEELTRIAAAFEAADAESALAFQALALNAQLLVAAGRGSLLYSLYRPPNISEELWNMLPVEDRIEILLGLDLAFVADASGGLLYVTNPLRIRRDPGLNGEIFAYATPGSQAIYTGERRSADGVEWYRVRYEVSPGRWVTGWVRSYYLSTGRSRVGFDPKDVTRLFNVHTNLQVWDDGGRLMSVSSADYLQIRDGPTNDYAAPEAVRWGQVVRWTGNSIEAGGHTWYQVTTWIETDDGKVEPFTGWARADRVQDYVPHARAPDVLGEDRIWVQLPGLRSFSQYNLFDVDSYVAPNDAFAARVPIPWRYDIGPQGVDGPIEAPYGALYGPDGVAMQGSGVVTVEVIDPQTNEVHQQEVYFTLNNPNQLDWKNEEGDPTGFAEGGWTNGRGAEIANPEAAEFRVLPEPPKLRSGFSAAGPPEYRGHRIWAPRLMDPKSENPQAVFDIEDAGGAFPPGSPRFDLYIEDPGAGLKWYRNAERRKIPVYIDQPIPPGLDAIPPELLPIPPESEEAAGP